MAYYLRLDLHLFEGLVVVDTLHLRQDDRVPRVRLHHLGLLQGRGLLLGLSQALQPRVQFPPQAPVQPLRLRGAVQLHLLYVGQVQQLAEVHAMVGELAKGPLLLLLYFCHLVGSSRSPYLLLTQSSCVYSCYLEV